MLYIANDHAGFDLKAKLVEYLKKIGVECVDLGTGSRESVDFPDYCKKLVKEVKKDEQNRGILICGSGIGMSICANRNKGIRAGLCTDVDMAMLSRQHNDANVLILPGRLMHFGKAKKILRAFLGTQFFGGKYKVRMDMIDGGAKNGG
ncbi:MAG: ribose 5-phosphate isomerase B [Clostridia bacterium]|nr:ribose 5-phosphate isomerase B [Clostridia bacterium]